MKKTLFQNEEFEGRDCEWSLPKGFMFGGLIDLAHDNLRAYAAQYMNAADIIINAIYNNQIEDYYVANPVFYLYRHAVELYLKNVLRKKGMENNTIHSLHSLIDKIDDIPNEIRIIILELHNIDPRSINFRYNSNRPPNFPNEEFCDAGNLKDQMRRLRSYFEDESNA